MYPQLPEQHDPVTRQPRRIPWTRWMMYAGGGLLVLATVTYLWLRSYSTITVAADTTYLTAPLAADGYPDYIAYLNSLNSEGITPENNAWIPLLVGMDSGELDEQDRARHCQRLGIPVQGLRPGAFQPFSSRSFRESVSTELLVASSAAAQPPWYVESLRLSAYNVVKRAEQDLELEALIPDEVPADERPLAEQTLDLAQTFSRDSAEAIAELAEDPDAALARYDLMLVEEIPAPLEGEGLVPDLRKSAWLSQHSLTNTPPEESIAAWRAENIRLYRDRYFEREERIINTRPWSRAECPLAAHWLDTQSAALDRLLAEIQQRDKFYIPYLTPLNKPNDEFAHNISIPHCPMWKALGQSLQQRAFESLQRADLTSAIRDFEKQLQSLKHQPASPFLVDSLIALQRHNRAMQLLAALAAHPDISDEQLASLAQFLTQPHSLPSFAQSWEVERIATIDYIVNFAARGKKTKGLPDIDRQVIAFIVICWDDVLGHMNELFDRAAIGIKNKDLAAIRQLAQEVEIAPADLPKISLLPSQRTAIAKFVLSRLLLEHVFSAYARELIAEARHDLARVMIALERYHRANNNYPAALAELVPRYLPAVPNDPFAGQPLKYFRTESGGYRAYSFGYNGIDDGGAYVLDNDGEYDVRESDLVIGSLDEIPPRLNLAW